VAQSGKPLTVQSFLGIAQDTLTGAAFGALGGLAGAGVGVLLSKVASSLASSLMGNAVGGSIRTAVADTVQRVTQRISESLLPAKPSVGWMDSEVPSGATIHHSPTATAIGDDAEALGNFGRSTGLNGNHDVILHGTQAGEPLIGGRVASVQEVADAVLANPDYVPGCSVTLVMCYGARGASNELANILGVDVKASIWRVSLDDGGALVPEYPEW